MYNFAEELTEKGFSIEQMMLWLKYQEYLRNPSIYNTSQTHPGSRKLLGLVDVAMEMTGNWQTLTKGDKSHDLDNIIRFGWKYYDESHFPWEQKNVFSEIDKVSFL